MPMTKYPQLFPLSRYIPSRGGSIESGSFSDCHSRPALIRVAMPKSESIITGTGLRSDGATFCRPSNGTMEVPLMRMLLSLMSRCTMLCACRYSSALVTHTIPPKRNFALISIVGKLAVSGSLSRRARSVCAVSCYLIRLGVPCTMGAKRCEPPLAP